MDIKPVPFDEDWDLSKIDSSTIQSILLSNVMYTKLLEEILKTDLNLNVIVENQTNSGLVYKNDIEKYVNMKIQDITKNSMNKLNKHLMDLHSNLDNIILDDYLKKIKSLIDLKYENYIKNKNNIQENVDNCIINIYNDVKDDAINLCKINNCENDGY
jgi:flagellar motility protein MotE (MotC chaperone)